MKPKTPGPDQPLTYEFHINGNLDNRWASWFEGLELLYHGSNTILRGPVVDQAALHGLLAKFRDLGLTLLSMRALEEHGTET